MCKRRGRQDAVSDARSFDLEQIKGKDRGQARSHMSSGLRRKNRSYSCSYSSLRAASKAAAAASKVSAAASKAVPFVAKSLCF
jgi:hypothetical protein